MYRHCFYFRRRDKLRVLKFSIFSLVRLNIYTPHFSRKLWLLKKSVRHISIKIGGCPLFSDVIKIVSFSRYVISKTKNIPRCERFQWTDVSKLIYCTVLSTNYRNAAFNMSWLLLIAILRRYQLQSVWAHLLLGISAKADYVWRPSRSLYVYVYVHFLLSLVYFRGSTKLIRSQLRIQIFAIE